MARRIPTGIKDVAELGRLVDSELQRLDVRTQTAFVGTARLANSNESYFFTEGGVLKYFNSTTSTVKTVTMT